jgi:KDO2-lipid IV(A) lauroyltransferase
MDAPRFTMALLHPKYWPIWIAFGVLALLAQLPFKWQMWMGRKLGRLLYRLATRRRAIAERNIELCFPDYTAQQRQDLILRHFESNGLILFEMGMAWFMPYWRLRKRFVVKGREHWDALQNKNQGALVIGLHMATLEIANACANRFFTMSVSYRPHSNAVYDYIQYRGRSRHNPKAKSIARHDMRGMVRTLKKGGLLWYAPDQDYGPKISKFTPYFGIETATLSMTPRLLKMAKVPALTVMYHRLPDFSGYVLDFRGVLEGIPSGDDIADLTLLNQHIEACVREQPEEYWWVHRRFKTRPKGQASFYE